jgi:RNAse (barnase) inhibitor barstar
MVKTLTIIGRNIHDIPSFYAEINRVLMADEDWNLANSLDALNDLLYGGYGAIKGREPIRLVWQDMANSASTLGMETTRAFLEEKLRRPDVFNIGVIAQQLDALERGVGQTYFDIVLEIFGDHPNIELVAA